MTTRIRHLVPPAPAIGSVTTGTPPAAGPEPPEGFDSVRVRSLHRGERLIGPATVGLPPPAPTPPPPHPDRCFTLKEWRWALAQRLYEATQAPAPMQFWDARNLDVIIREALQTFNACAYWFRQEFVFATEPGQAWYDITEVAESLRALTTLDLDLISQIEYHILEPQTLKRPLEWEGSKQFDLDNILTAIQESRDQTLSETGCTVNQSLVPAVPGRTYLDGTVMDIRRLCWLPNPYQRRFTPNVVMASDLWATQSFHAMFPQRGPGTPLLYRRTSSPPFSFDVDIEPAVNGEWDILTTNTNGRLSIHHDTIIPVPNDWTHVVKYGALSQLFGRESCAKDTLRADYCLKRWKQGLAMMQEAPALLAASINNVPVIVDSMSNGDFYDANWQGKKHAKPKKIYYSGLNMLGLSPIPDAVYAVTAPVVRNMPLPFHDEDCIEVGRDDFYQILNLAQHIAMLTVGGAEFQATFPLYAGFLRHCALTNSKLNAMSLWREWMDYRPQEEMIKVNPVFSPTADPVKLQNGGTSGTSV